MKKKGKTGAGREKGMTLPLIFISSPLKIVSGEKKTPALGATSILKHRFTNPVRYITVNWI